MNNNGEIWHQIHAVAQVILRWHPILVFHLKLGRVWTLHIEWHWTWAWLKCLIPFLLVTTIAVLNIWGDLNQASHHCLWVWWMSFPSSHLSPSHLPALACVPGRALHHVAKHRCGCSVLVLLDRCWSFPLGFRADLPSHKCFHLDGQNNCCAVNNTNSVIWYRCLILVCFLAAGAALLSVFESGTATFR